MQSGDAMGTDVTDAGHNNHGEWYLISAAHILATITTIIIIMMWSNSIEGLKIAMGDSYTIILCPHP